MKKFLSASDKKRNGKRFNFRPALFSAAFFALGIAFSYSHLFLRASPWWLLCAVPVFFVVLLSTKDKAKALAALALLFCCFSVGALRFSCEIEEFRACKVYTGEHTVAGTVTEKNDYGGFSRIVLSELSIDGERAEGKLAAALGGSFSKKVALSDRVLFSGTLETDVSLFGDYGFKSDDVSKKIRYTANVASLSVTGKEFDLFRAARSRMRRVIYAGMDEESASVTYALLTGDTSGIESGLLENVRLGGVAHIFAVSGLHVGALYSFCRLLIDKTRLRGLPALVRFFLTAAALVFYGGVCGFSASVVRAMVMCLVLYASALLGIKSDLLENTGVAALFLLALHPVALFDTGFLLSFAACLSIGFLSRSLQGGILALFPRGRRVAEANRKSGKERSKYTGDANAFPFKKAEKGQEGTENSACPEAVFKAPGGFGRISDEKLVGPLTFGEADKKSAFDPAALSERGLQEQGKREDKISVPETGAKRIPPVGNGVCEFYIDGRGLVRKVDKPLGLGERVKQAVASFLSVSLAAQIGTAPVLLASFGYVSLCSLLLNCLFVPLIGAVFALLLALVFFSCLLPLGAAPVLLYLPSVFWSAALLVFHAADFSFVLTGFKLGAAAILYYAIVVLLSGKINIERKKKRFLFLLFLCAFVFLASWINAETPAFLSHASISCVFIKNVL